MPKDRYPREYFANPRIDKPLAEIYADLDAYTMEVFADEPAYHEHVDLWVLLPPLGYEGRFLKGILISQGVDYLCERFPRLPQLFFTLATSRWSAYPWSRRADGYLALYANPHREAWFRRTHPDRADKILLPLQSADFTHDYALAPVPFLPKDFDVICVSRLHDLKNLPLIASALKVYQRKYRPIRMALVAGKEFDLNFKGLDPEEQAELRKVEEILEHPHDYIEFIPRVKYFEQLPGYLSRSRLYVLGALLEGKNRALYEAMSCNTPVVCFRQFNQYARGDEAVSGQRSAVSHASGPERTRAPAFPEGAGLYAPEFDAESLADTFHEVLQNETSFHPRRRFLEVSGRKNFFNQCVDAFPYYRTELPDHRAGQHVQNLWLDLAVQANYQLSLLDFLYDRNPRLSRLHGVQTIDEILAFYFSRFGLAR
jgi:glycosyltransferase involved in cell wall biosynthesis